MRKILMGGLVVVSLALLVVGGVLALPANKGIDKAKEVSPAIDDDTGEVKAPPEFVADLPESELTKIVFIRFAPGFPRIKPAKPACNDGVAHPSEQCGEPSLPGCPVGSVCVNCKCVVEEEAEPTACYGFLAGSKPRWNWVEDYYYSDATLEIPSASAVSTWENATTGDIFRVGVSGTYDYEWGTYDNVNSLSYGNYDDTGICPTSEPCVIAVTALWFRGKNIYEYDIMFDIDYTFGDASVDPAIFDLNTVTLHEFGHGAGLNDLYDSLCSGNVMYGYYTGEKTTLGNGDITGIQNLYGM